ncbi:nitrogenase iron-molybdenum cofactor biosynthesis protein NifN [Nitrincola alkalisediminis]|uniref:nitrogenase iron-molybdenum cofactor biosynthesis protein NifN n=1 Tax=Nitrincola alkalisediminis TaxID=1366656 RepID=UPI0018750699|nr:nitrogenase iron-molybdenum cofactor biosynthesis protein NifN [Nitrincola alkalisediminis]
MAKIIKRHKPLAVSPLKVSQPTGAVLALLGIRHALPMLHGSQGCSAFAKVFFVRHFREPIPLQTTAMDQTTTVMGADDNVFQGLRTLIEKRHPALIGIPTTGLSETQGSDIQGLVTRFYQQFPEYTSTPIIPIVTPDYSGGLESGYALAVEALIDRLVPDDAGHAGENPKQINVLVSSMLTAADLEYLRDLVERFSLEPVILPDVGDALDGHLTEDDFTPVTIGGTPVDAFATLGKARATLVIGRSLHKAANLLHQRTGVEDYRFDSLMGLEAMDRLVETLHQLSGQAVSSRLERERSQLQDSMLDTHFMLGFARYAVAADPDLLLSLSQLLVSMGGEVVAAVSPHNAPLLSDLPVNEVFIGDLEDLEHAARTHQAQLLISNAHAAETASRLHIPLVRAGWPVYDRLGAQHQLWIGYRGTRNTLTRLANELLEQGHQHAIKPYVSIYASTVYRADTTQKTTQTHHSITREVSHAAFEAD